MLSRSLASVSIGLVLAVSGCGGGGDDGVSSTQAAATTPTAPTTPASPASPTPSPSPTPTPTPEPSNPPAGSNADAHTLILVGNDSLTDGAGGSNWRKYFVQSVRGGLGDGGPGYHGFDVSTATDQAAVFAKTADLTRIQIDDANGKLSLDGRGVAVSAGDGTTNFTWKPASLWAKAKVFYLKQPGGGTMKCRNYGQPESAGISIDTSAAANTLATLDLDYQAVTNGGTVGCWNITGKVTVFGALFSLGSTGLQMGNLGKGGRTLQQVQEQDSDMRKQWFAALKPAYYLINAGMNDRVTRTAAQHEADLRAITQDVKAASPTTKIVIVQSSEPSDAATTYFLSYTPKKQSVASDIGATYFDLRNVTGSYSHAVASGYMFDVVHPNDVANKLIGPFIAQQLGLQSSVADPGATPY